MFYNESDVAAFRTAKFNFIIVEEQNNLFTIKLNRPQKRNAFTPAMVEEIAYAMAYAQQQQNIWCLLIDSTGPIFCAGMDLNVFQNLELDLKNTTLPLPQRPVNLGEVFDGFTKPSIAKVHGAVMAGAFLIVCGCTFVVASKSVEFSLPEVKRGIFPMQVLSSLLKVTSPRQALQMCILAETYSAEQAKTLGIVSHLCTTETIDETCHNLIETVLSNSPNAINKGIAAYHALEDISESERFSFLASRLDELRNSADAAEGIAAFKEKRIPRWINS